MRILTFTIVLFISWVTGEVPFTQPTIHSTSNIKYLTTNTTVFKVIIDESSASTNGALIVGARNSIIKFDASTLTLVDSWTNGPFNDSSECKPSADKCSNRYLQDNDNHVVFMHQNTPYPSVVTCGTVQQGMCSIHKYNNLSTAGWIGDPSVITNYVSSKKYTLAIPIKTSSDSAPYSYVIGHEYDDRPEQFSPPTLSVRKMKAVPRPSFDYSHDANVNSTIDIRNELKRSYRINYIYGFSDSDYFYIVTNQKSHSHSNEARIARACINDTTMTTYTELRLECPQRTESPFSGNLTLATAAYHGNSSFSLKHLKVPSNGKALYIAFTDSRDNHTASALCAISMADLTRQFNSVTDDCMDGGDKAIMHPAYDNLLAHPPNQEVCVPTRHKSSTYCAPRSSNFYMLAQQPVPLQPLLVLPTSKITSLITYVVKNSTIALIGTHRGEVIKSQLSSPSRELFRGSFSSPSSAEEDEQVRPEPAVDSQGNFAYLAVSKHLVKFPLKSCAIYTKCSDCLQVNDPLGCGWCGNRCASARECSTTLSYTCPPIIHDFTPKFGPTKGGTEITIVGDNFGLSNSNTSVEVDIIDDTSFTECPVKSQQNEKIVCMTGSAVPLSGKLKVKVAKQSHPTLNYTIEGGGESESLFTFMDFTISSIHPSFGTKSGGTVFRVNGNNLHIGLKKSVEIVNSRSQRLAQCVINSVGEKEIYCTMSEMVNSTDVKGNLTVTIDGERRDTSIGFTFKPDPVITRVLPTESPLTAKLNVTITGHNLDSIATPVLDVSGDKGNLTLPCHTINSSLLHCQLPALDDSWKHALASLRLTDNGSALSRDDDSSGSSISFHPDPWFSSSFDPVSIDDMVLEVRGENIRPGYAMNITVGPEGSPCEILKSDTYRLTCRIQTGTVPSLNDSLIVNWSLGEMQKTLGFVTFIDKRDSGISSWTAVIIVVIAIPVIIFLWLKRSRPSKQEYSRVCAFTAENRTNGSSGANEYCRPDGQNASPPTQSTESDKEYQDLVLQLQTANKFIAREYLIPGEMIGSGYFAEVYTGTLEDPHKGKTKVAIKTLKNHAVGVVTTFLQEAAVMQDFQHPNVLTLIGVSFSERDNVPSLVLPYMSNNDLLKYVRDDKYEPTIRQLLTFTLDIARGMAYLSGLKIIHRDLAARNCMLDDQLRVHVADFGLSRDVYEREYYTSDKAVPLPFRWMAIESLERNVFTTKSDVWSFGVTSWEVICRGLIPYAGFANSELPGYLRSGERLAKADYCPESIYKLWTSCWKPNPNDRPTFDEIVVYIENFFKKVDAQTLDEKVYSDSYYKNVNANGKYYNETNDVAELE